MRALGGVFAAVLVVVGSSCTDAGGAQPPPSTISRFEELPPVRTIAPDELDPATPSPDASTPASTPEIWGRSSATTTVTAPTTTIRPTTSIRPSTTTITTTTTPRFDVAEALPAGGLIGVELLPTIMHYGGIGGEADYSGFSGAVRLESGTILASGFDDLTGSPERSALWRSTDGTLFERVGKDLSFVAGQQTIVSLHERPDGSVLAVGHDLGGTTPAEIVESNNIDVWTWRSDDDGVTWSGEAVFENAIVTSVDQIGDDLYAVYVEDFLNVPRTGIARLSGDGWAPLDLTDSGEAWPASIVTAPDGTLMAFGVACDLGCQLAELLNSVPGVPAVPAVWSSADGSAWTRTEAVTGLPHGAELRDAQVLDGEIFGAVSIRRGDDPAAELHRSPDGVTWTLVADIGEFPGRDAVRLDQLQQAGEGHLAAIVTHTSFSLQRDFSTLVVVELETGAHAAVDLSTRAEILQVETLHREGDLLVAYGREDRIYSPDNKRVEITIEIAG